MHKTNRMQSIEQMSINVEYVLNAALKALLYSSYFVNTLQYTAKGTTWYD